MGNGSLPPEGQKPEYPDLHARFKNRKEDEQEPENNIEQKSSESDADESKSDDVKKETTRTD